MLRSVGHLEGSTIQPLDEALGTVAEAYFDDEAWAIRYLVVNTGTWLLGRKVLVSPYSVKQPLGDDKVVHVTMTREQVRNSPSIDAHMPVSRQHEQEYLCYYGFPEYWGGNDLWAMGSYPLLPISQPADIEQARHADRAEVPPEDVHLRSTGEVAGYDIAATDGSIGHVKDFIFDDASWAIRYLVVDTRNWWPGGRKVLVATRWIERIEWSDGKVYTPLTREQVKASPEFDDAMVLDRDYEARLHASYGRPGYWDK